MADIKFTGTADFSQVEKAYDKLEAGTKRLEEQAAKLARAAEQGGTAQQRAAERAADAAAKARESVDKLGESLGKSGNAGVKSGDDIKRAFDGATRDVAKLETANNRLAKSVEAAGEKQATLADGAKAAAEEGISQIKSLAFSWASLGGIVSQVGEAYARVGENQKKALEAHLQQAPAEELVIKNLVGISPKQKREVLNQLDQMAKEVGIESGPIKRSFAEAISKAGGDIPLAMEATRAAAGIHRLSPDQMSTTVAAGATLSRVLGISDPKQALGFANSFQAATAESSQQSVMGVLPGAVGAVLSSVPKQDKRRAAEEAAAVLAALNQANSAPGLASAATSEVGLASQLKLFFQPSPLSDEEKDIKAGQKAKLLSRVRTLQENKRGDPQEIVQAQIARARSQIAIYDREIAGMGVAEDPGTFAGRIAAIQGSEDLQNRLIPNIHGEAAFVDAMKDLLRGKKDSRVFQEYHRNLTGIRVGASGYEQQRKELSPTEGLTAAVRISGKTEIGKQQQTAEMLTRNRAAEIARIKEEAGALLDDSATNLRESIDVQEQKLIGSLANIWQSSAETKVGQVLAQAQTIRERYGAQAGNPRRKGSGFFSSRYEPATDEQLPEDVRDRVKRLEKRGMELRHALLRAQKGEEVPLPSDVPSDAAPLGDLGAAVTPTSTAAAAADASAAYRALPTVDEVAAGGTGGKKFAAAVKRSTREEKGRYAARLKKIQAELSGHGAKLKQPGYREQLQAEAEQLRGQISDVETRGTTETLIPDSPAPAARPAGDESAMAEISRQQLTETRASNATMRLLAQRLGSSAARTDLQVAVG